jgi:hypothetical protein
MEEKELSCPQCGLVNNNLAEACAQCGIIFVKNHSVTTSQVLRDEQKKKAIEAAEAILDQTLPPSETDVFGNNKVKEVDLLEDTVEIQIPFAGKAAAVPEEPKLEEDRDSETPEIKMDAIEIAPESLADAIDAEELFLSEITTTHTAEATSAERGDIDGHSPAAAEKTADSSVVKIKSDSVKQDTPDREKAEPAVKQPEAAPPVEIKLQENTGEENADGTQSESAEPVESQSPSEEIIELKDTQENSAAKTGPTQQKIPFAEKKQPLKVIEEVWEKQQQVQVLEALRRQREKQARTEALNKEQAAQVNSEGFGKKKLDRAKAEALRKQKAAQAKAEALKKQKAARTRALALKKRMAHQARLEVLRKQKEAQAKAEASAREIEVASVGIIPTASNASAGNHERLLGLLKKYKGKAIGINYDNSAEIKEAELVDANEEFFSVMVKDKKLQYSYPLKTILTIVEGQEGVEAGDADQKTKFEAVIKVYPLVLFK